MLARIKEFLGMEAKPKEEASQQEVEKVAEEEKAKPRIGYIHLSGCTGDVMSLSEIMTSSTFTHRNGRYSLRTNPG
jgi:hypothetical protein